MPEGNIIVLLGDRYGWRPVPSEILATEFEGIKSRITNGEDKKLLEDWYWHDDNAVPPVYCLQPRNGEYKEREKWEIVETTLRRILLSAAQEMTLSEDDRIKYERSATEQEIVYGALKVPDANEHVFCFFRKINDLPPLVGQPSLVVKITSPPVGQASPLAKTLLPNVRANDFIDLDEHGNPDKNARTLLDNLKARLHQGYVKEICK